MKCSIVLIALFVPLLSGYEGTDDLLQYDNGTAAWIGGVYQVTGTWFDVEDFYVSPCDFLCDYSEWWFYHNPNMPWDTDMIVLELWTGDVSAPAELLRSDTICATHFMPHVVEYPEPINAGSQFWLLAITCFSTNGYPSIVFDGENNFTGEPHTFVQDGMMWSPIEIGGSYINAFIRAGGEAQSALESATWAWVKGLYRE